MWVKYKLQVKSSNPLKPKGCALLWQIHRAGRGGIHSCQVASPHFSSFCFLFSPLLLLFNFFSIYFSTHICASNLTSMLIYVSQCFWWQVFFNSLTFLWIESKSETIAHPGLVRRGTAAINLPGDARKDNISQDSKFSQVEKYICVNRGVFCVL